MPLNYLRPCIGPQAVYDQGWNTLSNSVTVNPAQPAPVVTVTQERGTDTRVSWTSAGNNIAAARVYLDDRVMDWTGGGNSVLFQNYTSSNPDAAVRVFYTDGSFVDASSYFSEIPPVQNVQAVATSTDTIRLTWDNPDNSACEIGLSTGDFLFTSIATTSGTSYDITGLDPGRVYLCRIRALNTDCSSPWVIVRSRTLPAVNEVVRYTPSFASHQLAWTGSDSDEDTSSSAAQPLNFGHDLSFFGTGFSSVYVNENGSLTIGSALSVYDPTAMDLATTKIFAPFFADISRLYAASGDVTYGSDTVDGRAAFAATWHGVFSYRYDDFHFTSATDAFQVVLIDRSDISAGDFDVEFNYDYLNWDTPDSETTARAGWSNGTGQTGAYLELPGSGTPGALLDSNVQTGLAVTSTNSTIMGRHVYHVWNEPDLQIDSDNNDGLNPTTDPQAEDTAEDDSSKPGKILQVDNGDSDSDGTPDFADGYNYDENPNPSGQSGDDDSANLHFVPIIFQAHGDPATLTFTIAYDASNPTAVTTTGSGSADDPLVYHLPTTGKLRLWTRDGSNKRSAANFDSLDWANATTEQKALGYYVAPGSYSAGSWAKLAQATGQPAGMRLTLYIESVKPDVTPGDSEIAFNVDEDGSGPQPARPDAVRTTSVQAIISADNNRDSKITFDDADQTSASQPFLFWLDDKCSSWGGSDYGAAEPGKFKSSDSSKIGNNTGHDGKKVTDISALRAVAQEDLENFSQFAVSWPDTIQSLITEESKGDAPISLTRIYQQTMIRPCQDTLASLPAA